MALPTIFCPQCDHLILAADQCDQCGWQRPVIKGEVGRPIWAVALEAKLPRQYSRPVAAGRRLYFITADGHLVALETDPLRASATIRWRRPLAPNTRGLRVAVWEEALLLGLEYTGNFPKPPGALRLLSAESGKELWQQPVEGASLSVPAVANGMAYFTVNTGWLVALDLARRQELWRRKLEPPWQWAPAAPCLTPTGLLILASQSGSLLAYHLERGQIAWTFAAGGWFAHSPVWAEGLIYARCWDQHLYALDAASGRLVWRYRAPRDYSSDVWVGPDYLYLGAKDYQAGAAAGQGAYALYTLDRRTGQRVGRYEVPGHIYARPVATPEAVFFATDDRGPEIRSQGTFYALNAEGRQLLWEPYVAEQRFQSDLLLLDDGVVAGTRQGAVYALRRQTGSATIEAPQTYLARAEWANAASAYALRADYFQAAELYERRLGQRARAAQLYLHAGDYQRVVERLGQPRNDAERRLALTAARALAGPAERAAALRALGAYEEAAQAFEAAGDNVQAGACYQQIQNWEAARAAYARDQAWEPWIALSQQLGRWLELARHFQAAGEWVQAAESFLKAEDYVAAAACFDQAGQPRQALESYRRAGPEQLAPATQRRLIELAEQAGETELAIDLYRRLGEASRAAGLAAAAGRLDLALSLYQEAGRPLEAAEMLEQLARYDEAAALFAQARRFGRAGGNWARWVELALERAGGLRYVTDTAALEDGLGQAIALFEQAADYAEAESQIEAYHRQADDCRLKLMQLRREPLLRLSLQADLLICHQGNVIRYRLENVGWGRVSNLSLSLGGPHLRPLEPLALGDLRRHSHIEGVITLVPELVGQVTLQIELRGQAGSRALRQPLTETVTVALADEKPGRPTPAGGAGVALDLQNYVGPTAKPVSVDAASLEKREPWWQDSSKPATEEEESQPVSPAALKHQIQVVEITSPGPGPGQLRRAMRARVLERLRLTLLDCGPFASGQALSAVFVDERISSWRDRLPEADNPTGRVDQLIAYLHKQYNTAGENVLGLFLRVLADRTDLQNLCHQQLAELAAELEESTQADALAGSE